MEKWLFPWEYIYLNPAGLSKNSTGIIFLSDKSISDRNSIPTVFSGNQDSILNFRILLECCSIPTWIKRILRVFFLIPVGNSKYPSIWILFFLWEKLWFWGSLGNGLSCTLDVCMLKYQVGTGIVLIVLFMRLFSPAIWIYK